MRILHLTSSIFFGGPERQMLGMAAVLPKDYELTFVSFGERGRCRPFLEKCTSRGYRAIELEHDTPHLIAAGKELTRILGELGTEVVLCHTYKANLVGRPVCQRLRVPVIAVSRAWTGEDFKVRCYDWLDRLLLPRFDRVVAVSEGQATQVRARARVPEEKIRIIRNSARPGDFGSPDPAGRSVLESLLPLPGARIVVSAGRLSPDKGFDVLIRAAASVCSSDVEARFVVFGEGVLKEELRRQVDAAGLQGRMVFAGFRNDLDQLMPHADIFVLPSYNEGLPNVVLEASAAGVPVVATAVSGTPEAILEGQTGFLIPAGDAPQMSDRLLRLLQDGELRRTMGESGRRFMQENFSFESQAKRYMALFAEFTTAAVSP